MAVGVQGTHTVSNISTDGHGRYSVKGTWAYRLGGKVPPRTKRESGKLADAHIQGVAKRGFKLGVKIKRGQMIELFSFRGTRGDVVLAADDAVSRELADAFGADAHEHWVGLVPTAGSQRKPSFPSLGVVTYSYKLVVSGIEHEPQALIVVATHQDTSFRQHYLMHVQLLSTRPARITTDVEALFTASRRR